MSNPHPKQNDFLAAQQYVRLEAERIAEAYAGVDVTPDRLVLFASSAVHRANAQIYSLGMINVERERLKKDFIERYKLAEKEWKNQGKLFGKEVQ